MKMTLFMALLSMFWIPAMRADAAPGQRMLLNTSNKGIAMEGYDPVAYFHEHRAAKGTKMFQSQHNGATYRFTSEDHKREFDRSPEQYLPAYGGFCGYAASIGKVRPADPRLWSIVDGRLILQHTKGAVGLWEKDVPGNKAKADKLWPRLVEAKAGSRNPVDRLLGKSVLPNLE